MTPGYRFALTASAALVLLGYKSLTIVALSPLPILLGWALECAALFFVWALSELSQQTALRPLRVLSAGLFFLVLHALIAASLAHTYFFESAAERHFSLLEVDLRTLGYFFTKVLPVRGLLLLLGLVAAMHALALAVHRRVPRLHPRRVALGLLAGFTLLSIVLATRPRVPSPVADMGADLWEELTTKRVVVDRTRQARLAPTLLDKSQVALAPDAPLPFKKVLVFVMETMTSELFEREQGALPKSTFVHAARANSHVHSRYFSTNQDSRTGMLSMLGSRFIPYEAYTEEGRDQYMFLGGKSSLVDAFARLGYRTAFAVSQAEIELVVGDLPWDERLHLEESEVAALSGRYLCFVPYEFEHSCEDRALLPRVLSFLDQHERAFLYQEFIWGHAAEYNRASGKSNTEYYSAYLDAVVAHLTKTGAIDDTLIVLTSDHGFRDKGLQTQRSVYQIPLWFYAKRFTAASDDRLHSHLDFKDLLLHELSPLAPPVNESPFVMIIGPTGTSFLAVLTSSGQFVLMKAREDERYLIHADGLAGSADPFAAEYLRLFEDYMAYFARLRG